MVKRPPNPLTESLSIEKEMKAEMASALKRVGRNLETALEKLAKVEKALATCAAGERQKLLADHQRWREEAEKQRWYLIIQREAMGIMNNAAVYELYPIPKAVRA